MGAVLLSVCMSLYGCKVVILSGPTTVVIGQTVTYVLEVSGNVGFDPIPVVVADVPLGWQLQSSTYAATVDGMPFSGSGVTVDTSYCGVGMVPPGYHRVRLEPDSPVGGPAGVTGSGEVTLEFLVADQPSGEYEILFSFGNADDCSLPAVVTINRAAPSFLVLVQTLFDDTDGVDGLRGVEDVTSSPDGHHLYVASGAEASVAAFRHDPATGALTFIETVVDGASGVTGMAVPQELEMSADGQYLYVASRSDFDTSDLGGIAVFSRHAATGELTFVERLLEDVGRLAISPGGKHLYAAASGLAAYARNEASGQLTYIDTVFPGGRLLMSRDGGHLYAVRSSDTTAYSRDDATGQLTFSELSGGATVAAQSPDSRHVYTTSDPGDGFSVWERDEVTGQLTLAFSNPNGKRYGIEPESMAVSPDGSHVVVVGTVAIAVYQRNRTTGELTLAESHYPYNLSLIDLEGTRALAFAPGGRHLSAASSDGDFLLSFETAVLFFDGFESGSTSAWSHTVE